MLYSHRSELNSRALEACLVLPDDVTRRTAPPTSRAQTLMDDRRSARRSRGGSRTTLWNVQALRPLSALATRMVQEQSPVLAAAKPSGPERRTRLQSRVWRFLGTRR